MSTGELISTLSNFVLLLALAVVLAWALRLPTVRAWLQTRRSQQRVQIVERVLLDRANRLYLMQVGGTWLLVGTGDKAAPQLVWQSPTEPRVTQRQNSPNSPRVMEGLDGLERHDSARER
jgi:flagellar biogenesis protein FliO